MPTGLVTRTPWTPEVWVRAFLSKVEPQANGCWVWTGQVTGTAPARGGYGHVRRNGRMQYAHRAYWEHLHGPVPAGLELDHLCRNRLCVNPIHLEPVTRSVNILRGRLPHLEKTHCPRGHPLDLEGRRPDGRRYRLCRTCHNEQVARSARHRAPQRKRKESLS